MRTENVRVTSPARVALGVLTGLIALVAMLRLVAGAFAGGVAGISGFALGVTLVAMVPWVAYVAWRARRSALSPRTALVALGLDLLGLVLVGVLVFGPVLALALSFAAFVLIWLGDRPRRDRASVDTFVRIEELREPEAESEAESEPDR